MARPGEPEAVRTTIVGGRPPGGGKGVGDVPRGVEVLVKKAAVDPTFKKILLEKRADAAEAIALKLEPAEAAMLDAVPLPQLEATVANTKVSPKLRPAFLGYAAGAMLAALTAGVTGCTYKTEQEYKRVEGINADQRPETGTAETTRTAGKTGAIKDKSGSEAEKKTEGVSVGAVRERGAETSPWIRHRYDPNSSGLTGIRPDAVIKEKHASSRREPSVSISGPSVTGLGVENPRRSADTLFRITLNRGREINRIYVESLKRNPDLGSGKVVVRYDIAPDGSVDNTVLISDTLGSAELARAVLGEVSRWRFYPIDEGRVTVVQPFVFITGDN